MDSSGAVVGQWYGRTPRLPTGKVSGLQIRHGKGTGELRVEGALLPRERRDCMVVCHLPITRHNANFHPCWSLMSLTTPIIGDLAIRDANPADAPALAALKLATFRETFLEGFAIPYPPRDLAIFEEQSYGLAKVSAELADPTHHTLVAEVAGQDGGQLVAYAHVGPCKLPHCDVRPGEMELYQLYLRRQVQGTGLGKALMGRAFDYLDAGTNRIWLGVWQGNERARALYRALGFAAVGEYKFPVGDWYDDELIMRRDPV